MCFYLKVHINMDKSFLTVKVAVQVIYRLSVYTHLFNPFGEVNALFVNFSSYFSLVGASVTAVTCGIF